MIIIIVVTIVYGFVDSSAVSCNTLFRKFHANMRNAARMQRQVFEGKEISACTIYPLSSESNETARREVKLLPREAGRRLYSPVLEISVSVPTLSHHRRRDTQPPRGERRVG